MNLPQGWHAVPDHAKSAPGITGSSVPVTIRKKWNSPISNVPQTKLPSYKSSNLRHQNKSSYLNSLTNKPKPTNYINIQAKPVSLIKEYHNEIDKLKKDLSTLKAENSILKAKVRRVDDENLQKGRQIEKMRAEIKTLQKNDAAIINKKNKESQELLSLRQKCLRLENSIKEKDITIKRLVFESTKHEKQSSTKLPTVQKQVLSVIPGRLNKNSTPNISEKESLSDKTFHSRVNLPLKTEVTKLQGIIHKLEKENLDLQQQIKIHSQEIRKLKLQLKSKDKMPLSQTFISRSSVQGSKENKNMPQPTLCNGNGKHTPNSKLNDSVVTDELKKKSKYSVTSGISRKCPPKHAVLKETNNIGNSTKAQPRINGVLSHIIQNKQSKIVPSKSNIKPVIKTSRTTKSLNKASEKIDVEKKVQEMRENIAAKKIQRSWREHKKSLNHTYSVDIQNEEEDFNVDFSEKRILVKGRLQIWDKPNSDNHVTVE